MKSSSFLAAVAMALVLAMPGPAIALPGSYARDSAKWCAANLPRDETARLLCANRKWCAMHWNDDRVTRIACDPMRSKVNPRLPRLTIGPASLAAWRDLTASETRSECLGTDSPPQGGFGCSLMRWHDKNGARNRASSTQADISLLPDKMTEAKFALRAHIALYLFPTTVVKIGVSSGQKGMMSVSWSQSSIPGRR